MNRMIEIKKEVQVNNIIPEVGDKIEIIKESMITVEECADRIEEFVTKIMDLEPEYIMADVAYELTNRYPR